VAEVAGTHRVMRCAGVAHLAVKLAASAVGTVAVLSFLASGPAGAGGLLPEPTIKPASGSGVTVPGSVSVAPVRVSLTPVTRDVTTSVTVPPVVVTAPVPPVPVATPSVKVSLPPAPVALAPPTVALPPVSVSLPPPAPALPPPPVVVPSGASAATLVEPTAGSAWAAAGAPDSAVVAASSGAVWPGAAVVAPASHERFRTTADRARSSVSSRSRSASGGSSLLPPGLGFGLFNPDDPVQVGLALVTIVIGAAAIAFFTYVIVAAFWARRALQL